MVRAKTLDANDSLPIKPVVFQVMLALTKGERHGWSIVKELETHTVGRKKILPGNLYRTLGTMLVRGLIEESATRVDPDLDDERRRYFRLTEFGAEVARAEAHRLERMVIAASSAELLAATTQQRR